MPVTQAEAQDDVDLFDIDWLLSRHQWPSEYLSQWNSLSAPHDDIPQLVPQAVVDDYQAVNLATPNIVSQPFTMPPDRLGFHTLGTNQSSSSYQSLEQRPCGELLQAETVSYPHPFNLIIV